MNEAARRAAIKREEALLAFYSAERRRGVDPLTANERMHEFAKRFDALPATEEIHEPAA